MLSKPKRTITVATNAELLNKHYYRRLWLAARNMGIPRRKWLDTIADVFYVIYKTGEPYPFPDIDQVFGDDPDMRWFGYYLMDNGKKDFPKSYSRKLERLRLIDLYFRIAYPHIAAHFGK